MEQDDRLKGLYTIQDLKRQTVCRRIASCKNERGTRNRAKSTRSIAQLLGPRHFWASGEKRREGACNAGRGAHVQLKGLPVTGFEKNGERTVRRTKTLCKKQITITIRRTENNERRIRKTDGRFASGSFSRSENRYAGSR